MNANTFLTRTDLEQALPDPLLRSMQLIHVALPLGPVLFAFVVIFMNLSMGSVRPTTTEFEIMKLLSTVHVVFALLALIGSEAVFRWLADVRRIAESDTDTTPLFVAKCVSRFRTASIARLAILEGAAMFGLMVCLVGLTRGILDVEPMYWLNIASTFVMMTVAVWKFPTRERVISALQELCSQS
jgi:hypothetical protein